MNWVKFNHYPIPMNKKGIENMELNCSCGSVKCGLIFIVNENRYQCGECIRNVYDVLVRMKKMLAETRNLGVDSMLRPKMQALLDELGKLK